MTTFSQLVDSMVSETKRPDLVSEIARYVNQTIREVHFSADRNAAVLYVDNFQESILEASSESAYSWAIPNPANFQKMAAVNYPGVYDRNGDTVWPEETTPGRHLVDRDYFYYRVGGSFVFSGYGGLNAQIAIGWFEFPPSLKYKSAAARPATYDVESGWSYADGIDTDELKAAAQSLVTNWLLMRWSTVLEEGIRAKVYKRLSDTERARTSYSMYQSLRQGLFTSEVSKFGG